jgi:Flp pilus assembly protein TadD
MGCISKGKPAVSNYETVTANPRRDTEAAVKLNRHGLDALAKGKFEKAEKQFKDALIKDVNFGPAHNNLGRLYYEQGKNYLAAWEFEYATKVMPQRGEAFNNLGLVMERVGKTEQAMDAYETANALCPNNPEIVGNLARVYWYYDQSNERVRYLLEQVIFIDHRPEWVSWAKEQIACGKLAAVESHPDPSHGEPPLEQSFEQPRVLVPVLPLQLPSFPAELPRLAPPVSQ